MIYLPPNNEIFVFVAIVSSILLLAIILTFISARVQHNLESEKTPRKEGKLYSVLYKWGFIEMMTTTLALTVATAVAFVYSFLVIPGKQTSILNEAYGIEITEGWVLPMHSKLNPSIIYIKDGQEYTGRVECTDKNHVTIFTVEEGTPLPLSD